MAEDISVARYPEIEIIPLYGASYTSLQDFVQFTRKKETDSFFNPLLIVALYPSFGGLFLVLFLVLFLCSF